jgi:hypothetical protein
VALANFAVAFGLLLASIKVEDDIADDRSWVARLVRWKLSREFQAARTYFRTLDPQFDSSIDELLFEHSQLEHRCGTELIPLKDYVQPTANAFGYVFGLAHCHSKDFGWLGSNEVSPQSEVRRGLAMLDPSHPIGLSDADKAPTDSINNVAQSTELRAWLTEIGHNLGAAIIAFDCAVDWERDQQRGRCNPLPNRASAEEALQTSQLYLSQAGWLCDARLPASAVTTRLLRGLCQRLGATRLPWQRRETWRSRWQDWGLLRQPGYTHARCDCIAVCCDCAGAAACEGACAGTECCAAGEGAAAGTDCCATTGPCCCDCGADCCVCWGANQSCGGTNKTQSTTTAGSAPTAAPSDKRKADGLVIGDCGIAVTDLAPSGFVEINRQRTAAQSESTYIEAGNAVEVIELRPFGAVVRKVEA